MLKESADGMQVQLSNGWLMPLEDLVRDYERLLKEELKKNITFETKEEKVIASKLKVGEWFRIDRHIVNKSQEEIRRKCNEAGEKGKELWERFVRSNEIADKYPDEYPQLIETYIFDKNWEFKTQMQMENMCIAIGDGMCCEIICDLELQMRICNGESVEDLVEKADRLPWGRLIQARYYGIGIGYIGYFGGGTNHNNASPPARFHRLDSCPHARIYHLTPYAFRRVRSTEKCFALFKTKQK